MGDRNLLVWKRDRANDWKSELKEERPPEPIEVAGFILPPALALRFAAVWTVTAYDPWQDRWMNLDRGDLAVLPEFQR